MPHLLCLAMPTVKLDSSTKHHTSNARLRDVRHVGA
jgi:hypothetical protein